MKFTVENFGPIKKAGNITVNPMTIFVGPSNTGKSYLAILIYAILKVLGDQRREYLGMEVNQDIKQNIVKIVRENSEKHQAKQAIKEIGELMMDHWFKLWANNIADELKRQIIYCFGEEGKNMMENGGHPVIRLSSHKNELILNLFSPNKSRLTIKKKQEIINSFSRTMNPSYLKMLVQADEIDLLIYHISKNFLETFTFVLLEQSGLERSDQFTRSHYLPAIRGGIMQSHRILVGALIERVPTAALGSQLSSIQLSGVLSDFMIKLIHVSDANKGSNRFHQFYNLPAGKEEKAKAKAKAKEKLHEISDALDNRILDGEIHAESSKIRYPDFHYVFPKGKEKKKLPLMNASSMVSELAPVSLFIRHYVGYGDLFILEEPEAHLHPGAQREISNILVQLVNAGVYVLITTHSDNILEQIGNYMQAAEVPENVRPEGIKYEKQILNQKKVSVYLFKSPQKKKSKGTTVKKIPFDPETGILTEDHLEVSSALYDETVTLLNRRTDNND